MEVLTAIVAALAGAVAAFGIREHFTRKSEKAKLEVALRTELRVNRRITGEILDRNRHLDETSVDSSDMGWCEIVPMSESAWDAVMRSGRLSYLPKGAIEPLTEAYAAVKRANFTAEKIAHGRYDPREGRAYTANVRSASRAFETALRALE